MAKARVRWGWGGWGAAHLNESLDERETSGGAYRFLRVLHHWPCISFDRKIVDAGTEGGRPAAVWRGSHFPASGAHFANKLSSRPKREANGPPCSLWVGDTLVQHPFSFFTPSDADGGGRGEEPAGAIDSRETGKCASGSNRLVCYLPLGDAVVRGR